MRHRGTVSSLRRRRVGSPSGQKGHTFMALDQQLADFTAEFPRSAPAGRPPYTRPGSRSFALSPLSRRPPGWGYCPEFQLHVWHSGQECALNGSGIPGRSWDSGRRRVRVGNHGIRDMSAIRLQKDSHTEAVNPAGPRWTSIGAPVSRLIAACRRVWSTVPASEPTAPILASRISAGVLTSGLAPSAT
jgi:hypothetical protein